MACNQLRFIDRQAGFGLIEILVVMGLMSIMALTMSTVISNMQKGQSGVHFRSEADAIQGEMRQLLSDSTACAKSLASSGWLDVAGSNYTVTSLKDENDIPRFIPGNVYGAGNVRLDSMNLTDVPPLAPGPRVELLLRSIMSTTKQVGGAGVVPREIKIIATIDSTRLITGCIAAASDNSDGIWRRMSPPNQDNIYYLGDSASGLVGIGTTAPSSILSVRGTAVNSSHLDIGLASATDGQPSSKILLAGTGVQHAGILYTPSATAAVEKLQFTHGGGSDPATHNMLMTILGNGNVGIGTTSPQATLDVQGAFRVGSPPLASLTGLGGFYADWDSIRNEVRLIAGNASGSAMVFHTATSGTATEKMRIDENGRVGIGTTSPTSQTAWSSWGGLDITSSAGASGLSIHKTDQQVEIATDGAGGYIDVNGAATASNNFLAIRTVNASSSYGVSEVARFASDGNVGIGYTSPDKKLTISSSAPWDGIRIMNSNAPTGAMLYLSNDVPGNNGAQILLNGSGNVTTSGPNSLNIYNSVGGGFAFTTPSAGTFLKITNDGKVGIGTVAPSATLDVRGSLIVTGTANLGRTVATNTCVINPPTLYNYCNTQANCPSGYAVVGCGGDNSATAVTAVTRAFPNNVDSCYCSFEHIQNPTSSGGLPNTCYAICMRVQ